VIRKRLAVLVSGNGSNLQAIIDACKNNKLTAEIAVVISNQEKAFGLVRAQNASIPALWLPFEKGTLRKDYDERLARQLLVYKPDFIVLAGWMRLLSQSFLSHFPGKVINIHPALPGCFPGTHAIERAYQGYQAGLITHTGVMVHYVPNEGIDDGPVLIQDLVSIDPKDTLATLEERIHTTEHRLLVEALIPLCNPLRGQ
jgi:formyltetrahydrofolate-dependent phosphoribosylglycinamide formyltransferase